MDIRATLVVTVFPPIQKIPLVEALVTVAARTGLPHRWSASVFQLDIRIRPVIASLPSRVSRGFSSRFGLPMAGPSAPAQASRRGRFPTSYPGTAFLLFSLNPMVGVTDDFPWAILDENSPAHMPALVLSFLLSAGFLALGMRYFWRLERRFAGAV